MDKDLSQIKDNECRMEIVNTIVPKCSAQEQAKVNSVIQWIIILFCFRKILDALAMAADKEREGSLGSDGETSDYQRSTPSPQDAATRITELGEGECQQEEEEASPGWTRSFD